MRSSLRSKSVSQLLANGTMSASRRPATAMTSTGEVVGYVTTNQGKELFTVVHTAHACMSSIVHA